ncbi:MAG: NAD(+)--rifampin ADP-ribosyltransferase [Acidimicrobiia bacterium]|nr:NAD(+)--rifampin ADP-ribosyltransferase [Acidimicrobiia bacterium]MBJ7513151.1 NAD(+)--rifampin ADP-ribosyltransferase [Acidimicrobiia bacterium]
MPSEVKSSDDLAQTPYYHCTRAALLVGDLIKPGYKSNFGSRRQANHVYLTATVDAAMWGAELAAGEEPGRVYVVEPTGTIEDDPNLTDKKFLGNPTKSYRSREPFRVIGELTEWEGHDPELLNSMKEQIEHLRELGVEAIDE